MPPKFQSSFIPRGPVSAGAASADIPTSGRRQRDLFSFAASALFTLSILFGAGVFGYKYFLNYRIAQMGEELEAARAALEPETVTELIRLNARLDSTQELLRRHKVISPLFDFLEAATPKTVRYTDFAYNTTNKGLELRLLGEARGYAALAAASDVFNRSSGPFRGTSFSDLRLDERGNVIFVLTTTLDPSFLSYERLVQNLAPTPTVNTSSATTTATSTPRTATSTTPQGN